MKNLPFFTTEHGVASLTLDQIPYTYNAYITIQNTEDPEKLIGECVDFCKAVGAEHIYACNHSFLCNYPVFTDVVEMTAQRETLPQSALSLHPVTEDTADAFCRIYNEKMQGVKTAGYMDRRKLEIGSAYFLYDGDAVAGIGIAKDDTVGAVASLQKGAGRNVLCALCQILRADTVRLEVASENKKAVDLYTALGFKAKAVLNTWYKIV